MATNSKATQKAAEDKRGKNLTVVLYPEDLPNDWLEKIRSLKAKIVISPLHDNDLKDDGTPKKAHHHVIFMFSVKKSISQLHGMLAMLFGESNGAICGVANLNKEL